MILFIDFSERRAFIAYDHIPERQSGLASSGDVLRVLSGGGGVHRLAEHFDPEASYSAG